MDAFIVAGRNPGHCLCDGYGQGPSFILVYCKLVQFKVHPAGIFIIELQSINILKSGAFIQALCGNIPLQHIQSVAIGKYGIL